MISKINKNGVRAKRHLKIRAHLKGTAEMPRLCVYRSTSHIYAQVIDDIKGITIASASTVAKGFDGNGLNKPEAAKKVGQLVAERAIAAGVKTVVFDRGGYLYTGRVKALADGARESGLEF